MLVCCRKIALHQACLNSYLEYILAILLHFWCSRNKEKDLSVDLMLSFSYSPAELKQTLRVKITKRSIPTIFPTLLVHTFSCLFFSQLKKKSMMFLRGDRYQKDKTLFNTLNYSSILKKSSN